MLTAWSATSSAVQTRATAGGGVWITAPERGVLDHGATGAREVLGSSESGYPGRGSSEVGRGVVREFGDGPPATWGVGERSVAAQRRVMAQNGWWGEQELRPSTHSIGGLVMRRGCSERVGRRRAGSKVFASSRASAHSRHSFMAPSAAHPRRRPRLTPRVVHGTPPTSSLTAHLRRHPWRPTPSVVRGPAGQGVHTRSVFRPHTPGVACTSGGQGGKKRRKERKSGRAGSVARVAI